MIEEEKKEEVKNEEDKKPLGPLRDLPEYEVGSEDVSDWRWAYRYSAIATGLWNAESKYGKLPLSEWELLEKSYDDAMKWLENSAAWGEFFRTPENPSTWGKVSSKAKKVNSKIDDFADAYVKTQLVYFQRLKIKSKP